MNCERCRGACCESFSLPAITILSPTADARRWIELHGTNRPGHMLHFECRCTALTAEGRCGIYETRPQVCRVFKAGGVDCLDTLRRRRTPEEYQAIREDGDPETIHAKAGA